jgi:hypothetical protein
MSRRGLLTCAVVCFVFLFSLSSARGEISAIHPAEGTVGTQFTLSGSGFGTKQGEVLVGAERCKVLVWSDTVIRGAVTEPLPAGDYLVTVALQGNKKQSESMTFSSFAMRSPRITPPASLPLVPDGKIFTINGFFFGDKKGEITLVSRGGETEKATVVDWNIDAIRFKVPEAASDACMLRVSNGVGEDALAHPSCSPPMPGGDICYDRGEDPPPSNYYDAKHFHDANSSAAYYDGHLFFFSVGGGNLFHDPPVQVQRFENGAFVADNSVPSFPSGTTYATLVPLVIEGKLWVFLTGCNSGLYYTRYSTTGGWEDKAWHRILTLSTNNKWEIAPVYNSVLHRIEVYYDHDGDLELAVSYDLGATWSWVDVVLAGITSAPSAVFWGDKTLLAVGVKSIGCTGVMWISNGAVVSAISHFDPALGRPFFADLGSDYFALIWRAHAGYPITISKYYKPTGQWYGPYNPIGNWTSNFPPNGFINYEPNSTGGMDRILYLLWGYPDCTAGQALEVTWVMNRLEDLDQ